MAIAPVKDFRFTIRDSFANGNACANIGTFSTVLDDGSLADTDLIAVYRVNDEGKLVSMAAHWEVERTLATCASPSSGLRTVTDVYGSFAERQDSHQRVRHGRPSRRRSADDVDAAATHSTSGRRARQSLRTRSSSSGVWIDFSKP